MMQSFETDTLIDQALPEIIEIRRRIHMHPELGEQEKNTAELICRELKKLDIPYRAEVFGYGITAVIYGKDREHAIGIRADMDALPVSEDNDLPFCSKEPGVMHACGHDVHVSVLLGAARVLKQLADWGHLPLSVTLIFQPSEETIGGAEQMIRAGCMENPKVLAAMGLHIDPAQNYDKLIFTRGTMNAATCGFAVRVTGKSCHGAHPDQGIDPLLPACNMVVALQSILTRRMHPADACLITVGCFHSGTKENVIPDYSEFSGTIRVMDMANLPKIKEELARICQGIAAGYGAGCQIDFEDGYPTLVNDDGLLNCLVDAYRKRFGEDSVVTTKKPSLGADDFAYFCHASRGIYFDIGAKGPEDAPMNLHSPALIVDERCIRTGILAEVYGALELMEEFYGKEMESKPAGYGDRDRS